MGFVGRICTKGLWDESIPGIAFDENGISNFYRIQERLMHDFPRGDKGLKDWTEIVDDAKRKGRGKNYDCIIGVSGGVDSSYLMHLCKKEYGLRPLAVNFDNGFNSDVAVKNIKKVTNKLNIDLETYVVDYEEMKDVLRSFMFSGLPWIDAPTDAGFKSTVYSIASKEHIKYIFLGHDFRSEGKQPREWTSGDAKQLKYLHRKFGRIKRLKSFKYLTLKKLLFYGYFLRIKNVRPYYFVEHNKQKAKEFLTKEYGWEDYGGHHHENIFTKFAMAYWLPQKFGIDKRKITLSAQVVNGVLSRSSAIKQINSEDISEEEMLLLKKYILKKIDLTNEEFEKIWIAPNKFYYDYPSNIPYLLKFTKYIQILTKRIYVNKPMSFYEIEERAANQNENSV